MNLNEKIKSAKKRLIQMHYANKVGHIGGNLSALDAMMTLHHEVMTPEDTFILSKGHSSGALYITLWSLGKIPDEQLSSFHGDNTKLAGHPMAGWIPEIPVVTGSLGHGFSLAAGVALGQRITNKPGHVFCLTSDGEWQEGSNWEALIFYAHHKLTNLTILVDCNGLQGFGSTQDVASMNTSKLYDKMTAFGLKVTQIDGHDSDLIKATVKAQESNVILLNTIKGSGISFMENKMEWHYLPLNEQLFNQAITEIDRA